MTQLQQFRKKPIVIDAVQLVKVNWNSITDFLGKEEWRKGAWWANPRTNEVGIVTLEGTMVATENDWIIKGVKGEFYPCKPDIFEATYEPVASAQPVEADSAPAPQQVQEPEEWMRQFEIVLRSHKFNRDEFPVPAVLPRFICQQIMQLLKEHAPLSQKAEPPTDLIAEQITDIVFESLDRDCEWIDGKSPTVRKVKTAIEVWLAERDVTGTRSFELKFSPDRLGEKEWAAWTELVAPGKRFYLGWTPCDSWDEAVKECAKLKAEYESVAGTPGEEKRK